jgi:hypothetical protein
MNLIPNKRIKDLTGQIFSRLTVIEFSHVDKNRSANWKCLCQCSEDKTTTTIVVGTSLKSSSTKSCGCLNLSKIIERNQSRYIDLTNQKFVKLTALNLSRRNSGKDAKGAKGCYWNCLCECGNYTVVQTGRLISGATKSCGCLIGNRKNIIGQKFNRLKVISYHHTKNFVAQYTCLCDCGKEIIVSSQHLKSSNTKSCGCLKIERDNNQKKENHPNWRKDISEEERARLANYGKRNYLPEYMEWKIQVFKRDNRTCQLTGIKGQKICAHHLEGYNWCKEKRYELDNGITLSIEVHDLFHHLYGNRNNTREQFNAFKSRYDSGEWRDYQI